MASIKTIYITGWGSHMDMEVGVGKTAMTYHFSQEEQLEIMNFFMRYKDRALRKFERDIQSEQIEHKQRDVTPEPLKIGFDDEVPF